MRRVGIGYWISLAILTVVFAPTACSTGGGSNDSDGGLQTGGNGGGVAGGEGGVAGSASGGAGVGAGGNQNQGGSAGLASGGSSQTGGSGQGVGGSVASGGSGGSSNADAGVTDPNACVDKPQGKPCTDTGCHYSIGTTGNMMTGNCVCTGAYLLCAKLPAPDGSPVCPANPQGAHCPTLDHFCKVSDTKFCLCSAIGASNLWACP